MPIQSMPHTVLYASLTHRNSFVSFRFVLLYIIIIITGPDNRRWLIRSHGSHTNNQDGQRPSKRINESTTTTTHYMRSNRMNQSHRWELSCVVVFCQWHDMTRHNTTDGDRCLWVINICAWRTVRDTDIFGLSQSKRASLKLVSHGGDEMKWIETKRNENCLVSSVQSTNNLVTSPSLRHSVSCRSITVTRLDSSNSMVAALHCMRHATNKQRNNKQALQGGIVGTVS